MDRLHPSALERLINQFAQVLGEVTLEAETKQVCLRKAVGCAGGTINQVGQLSVYSRKYNGPSAKGNLCKNIVGGCGCAHSEPRVIMDLMCQGWQPGGSMHPMVMLVTYSPCDHICAPIINDSRIIDIVVYQILTAYDQDRKAQRIMEDAGVGVFSMAELRTNPELINDSIIKRH